MLLTNPAGVLHVGLSRAKNEKSMAIYDAEGTPTEKRLMSAGNGPQYDKRKEFEGFLRVKATTDLETLEHISKIKGHFESFDEGFGDLCFWYETFIDHTTTND